MCGTSGSGNQDDADDSHDNYCNETIQEPNFSLMSVPYGNLTRLAIQEKLTVSLKREKQRSIVKHNSGMISLMLQIVYVYVLFSLVGIVDILSYDDLENWYQNFVERKIHKLLMTIARGLQALRLKTEYREPTFKKRQRSVKLELEHFIDADTKTITIIK